jgi:putative flippase GtrA
LFLVAFFVRSVRGSAVFVAALLAQCLVLILFWRLSISYLWYNLIGCGAVLVFSLALERTIFAKSSPA